MTEEQKQELIYKIKEHPDTDYSKYEVPTEFNYNKTEIEVFLCIPLGYILTIEYEWHKEYNNKGEFGGWSNRNQIETLEVYTDE